LRRELDLFPDWYVARHLGRTLTAAQREVHVDVPSFSEAIRRALRQDPDVILVGEMRDLETIEAAISAAETGHLVFGTLHTNSAAKTVDRIVDAFPANMKDMIRAKKIQVAIIAVAAPEAQHVADQVVEAGVRAILNYAPTTLSVPPKVKVYHIDPVAGLQSMTYYL